MSFARRVAPAAVAVTVVALLLGLSGFIAVRTQAQAPPPARYYGVFTSGDVVEVFIEDVSCGSVTADATGNWLIDIYATAPCLPTSGDTVTFTRNGTSLKATETWTAGATPSNPAGVSGELGAATPTPTPTPTPKPTPPPEPTIEEVKVDQTLDLTTDVTVVDGKNVVQAVSDDGTVTATIPTGAVVDTTTIAVKVDRIADIDVADTVPTGTFIVAGQTININITDDQGQPITDFAEDVTFTLQVDPVATDVETIAVFFFDRTVDAWVQIPATVAADGTIEWSVNHLTLFALLRLSKVTFQLSSGLNSLTFTGATGTDAADVAAAIGANVENLLTFDAVSQSFTSFVPGAPAIFNTLSQLSQRDALFVRLAAGQSARYTATDIVPAESGERSVFLVPGLNAIGYTGGTGTQVATLLDPLGTGVISASRYNATTQLWETFVPGAPSFANTLGALTRLDVIFIRLGGSPQQLALPELLP